VSTPTPEPHPVEEPGTEPDGTEPDGAAGPSTMSAEAVANVPRILKAVGAVVGPTTLLTALAFYFGLLEVQGIFRWLGVSSTVFEFSVQDYLVRAADGLFAPVVVGAAAVAVAVWLHRLADAAVRGPGGERFVRVATPAAGVVGVGLVVWSGIGLVDPPLFAAAPLLPGLLLVVGTVLTAYAARLLRRWHDPDPEVGSALVLVEWVAVAAVVGVGLFWSVGNHAVAVGLARGQQITAALPATPDAVLFSEQALALDLPAVTTTRCTDPEGLYRVRYTGLKLVLRSGDQLLFVPADWTPATRTAVVLQRSGSLRLEFAAPGAPRNPTC
jgi:hypothetical protein